MNNTLHNARASVKAERLEFLLRLAREKSPLFEIQPLTYQEASFLFGVSVTTLKEEKAAGRLRFVTVGTRGTRFLVSAIRQWLLDRELSQRRLRRIS
jgi:excisionase family DNA binding protein